jgi:hypothetical protein
VKFHAQKQIGKSHVIDIFTSEDMENISLCIFQYFTLYKIIKLIYASQRVFINLVLHRHVCIVFLPMQLTNTNVLCF